MVDTVRSVQNTPLIADAIKKCLNLADAETNAEARKRLQSQLDEDFVSLEFVKFLKSYWNKHSTGEPKIYIHELLNNNQLHLAALEKPTRNPELEARIQRIKAKFEEDEYQRMVSNVSFNNRLSKKENISLFPEFKTLQGQLVAIINMVAVIGGAFVFGYKAVEYSLEEANITKQMLGGFILALIVAIADIYFLFKRLLKLDQEQSTKNK